jgi:hypothetical protein
MADCAILRTDGCGSGVSPTSYRRRDEPGFHWLVVVSLAPALVTYLVSQWLSQSIWGSRHLIFTLWPFLLVLADVVWSLRPAARTVTLTLVVVWAGFSAKAYSPEDLKIHWDGSRQMLDAKNSMRPCPFIPVVPIYINMVSPWVLKDQRLTMGPYVNSRKTLASLRAKAAG